MSFERLVERMPFEETVKVLYGPGWARVEDINAAVNRNRGEINAMLAIVFEVAAKKAKVRLSIDRGA